MKQIKIFTLSLLFVTALGHFTFSAHAQTPPSFTLSPVGGQITSGSQQTLLLKMNTGTHTANSYTAVIDVSGTAVPSTMIIASNDPAGMHAVTEAVNTIGNDKQIVLEVIGSGAAGTINTNNQYATVGTITYTAPSNTGNATFALDTNNSAVYAGASGNVMTGTFSETYNFQTSSTGPGAFQKVSPANNSAINSLSVTLDWSDSQGATGYEFCLNTSNSCTGSAWAQVPAGSSQVIQQNLTPNTPYYWQIRANDSDGTTYADGNQTFWKFTSPAAAPVPISIDFTFRLQGIFDDVGPQDATFRFKQPNTTTSANIFTDPQGRPSNIATASASIVPNTMGNYSATLTNIPVSATGTTSFKICIKAKSHLQKCLDSVSLTAADDGNRTVTFIESNIDDELLSGDVNDNNNIFIDDYGLVKANSDIAYVVPITKPKAFDIDNDGQITVDDLALTFINYTDFKIWGEE